MSLSLIRLYVVWLCCLLQSTQINVVSGSWKVHHLCYHVDFYTMLTYITCPFLSMASSTWIFFAYVISPFCVSNIQNVHINNRSIACLHLTLWFYQLWFISWLKFITKDAGCWFCYRGHFIHRTCLVHFRRSWNIKESISNALPHYMCCHS